jgi:hypothetical protein
LPADSYQLGDQKKNEKETQHDEAAAGAAAPAADPAKTAWLAHIQQTAPQSWERQQAGEAATRGTGTTDLLASPPDARLSITTQQNNETL